MHLFVKMNDLPPFELDENSSESLETQVAHRLRALSLRVPIVSHALTCQMLDRRDSSAEFWRGYMAIKLAEQNMRLQEQLDHFLKHAAPPPIIINREDAESVLKNVK